MTLLVIVLVFGGLIFAHELGHFAVAKATGVQVDEFALGFGPRLVAFRWGETSYAIRLLPVGGFVRMAGMVPPAEDDESADARSARSALASGRAFNSKTLGQRAAIIAAGPAMSFLVGVVLFAIVFLFVGVPSNPTLTVADVQAGYPAAAAGMLPGDRIVAIDGHTLTGWDALKQTVAGSAGKSLVITVDRDGKPVSLTVTPTETSSGGLIGVAPVMANMRMALPRAVGGGFTAVWGVIAGWFMALGSLVHGAGASNFIGPVGIGQVIGQAEQQGAGSLLLVAAVLTANLGLINLLPIPALDGSRLAFIGLEWLRGRPIDPEKENFIHFVGFALLILLSVVVTYRDILRLTG
ncbi:MAG TPA: RIP metalloprotease RseP [Bacillota bacterium]|nr:RIP metalloprotease RseP [Bacillota bacterium]